MNDDLVLYKCHKQVHAKPMTRGDYNNYKGWTIPADEDPNDDGYLVVYNRGSNDHYESWSPKHIFDDGYCQQGSIGDSKTAWVCGQSTGEGNTWEFAGVFSSEELAIAACRDEHYFIGPATVDQQLPHEPFDWPGAYYPIVAESTEK